MGPEGHLLRSKGTQWHGKCKHTQQHRWSHWECAQHVQTKVEGTASQQIIELNRTHIDKNRWGESSIIVKVWIDPKTKNLER